MNDDSTVTVLASAFAAEEIKAALPSFAKPAAATVVEVSSDILTKNINVFVAQFSSLLQKSPTDAGKVYIDEIELSLVVSASGGIQLLGNIQGGAQAGIKVKLKRR